MFTLDLGMPTLDLFEESVCWFQISFIFTPKIGEDEPILTVASFSNGLVQPPTRCF